MSHNHFLSNNTLISTQLSVKVYYSSITVGIYCCALCMCSHWEDLLFVNESLVLINHKMQKKTSLILKACYAGFTITTVKQCADSYKCNPSQINTWPTRIMWWWCMYLQTPSPLSFLIIFLCSGHFWVSTFRQWVCNPQAITVCNSSLCVCLPMGGAE